MEIYFYRLCSQDVQCWVEAVIDKFPWQRCPSIYTLPRKFCYSSESFLLKVGTRKGLMKAVSEQMMHHEVYSLQFSAFDCSSKILAVSLFAFGTSVFWQSIQEDPIMYVSWRFQADLNVWVHARLPSVCAQTHVQSLGHALKGRDSVWVEEGSPVLFEVGWWARDLDGARKHCGLDRFHIGVPSAPTTLTSAHQGPGPCPPIRPV